MTGTRDRIVESSALLFRRQGYAGTGLKQIMEMAGAQFGSLYHFFPGGKEQLGAQVIEWSGRLYQTLVEGFIDAAPDVTTGVGNVFVGAAETLRQTGYMDACPIETVALEVASTNETLREACAKVFDAWVEAATERLAAAGVERDEARRLGLSLICALEGAFVLSRAARTTEALDAAGALAVESVRAALERRDARPPNR